MDQGSRHPRAKYRVMGLRLHFGFPTAHPTPGPRSSCSNKPRPQQSLPIQTRRVQMQQASQPRPRGSKDALKAMSTGRDCLKVVVERSSGSAGTLRGHVSVSHCRVVYLWVFPRLTAKETPRPLKIQTTTCILLCENKSARDARRGDLKTRARASVRFIAGHYHNKQNRPLFLDVIVGGRRDVVLEMLASNPEAGGRKLRREREIRKGDIEGGLSLNGMP